MTAWQHVRLPGLPAQPHTLPTLPPTATYPTATRLDELLLSSCRRELGNALLRVQTAANGLREGARLLRAAQEGLYLTMRHKLRWVAAAPVQG